MTTTDNKQQPAVAAPDARSVAASTSHLDQLFQKLDPRRTRLIFAVDATGSREATWDLAAQSTAGMIRAAAGSGGIELQLVYFRGDQECVASKWMADAIAIAKVMSEVKCRAGVTQIRRVLAHIGKENARHKVAAAILISDACEENPNQLFAAASALRVPVFMFQEGHDEIVAGIFKKIANITDGAASTFDAGAAARLADLLKAVSAFATGGRAALAGQGTEAARLLLTQLK